MLKGAADRLLPSIVNEVGTPVSLASYLQVKMAVDEHLRWAAEAAKTDRTVHLGGYDKPHPTLSDVVYEPAGVVAAITGYNFPLNLAIFKFGSALAAGCTVVLLPSPRTPLTTLFLGGPARIRGIEGCWYRLGSLCHEDAAGFEVVWVSEAVGGSSEHLEQVVGAYLEGLALWWFGAWVSCGRHVVDGGGDAVLAPVTEVLGEVLSELVVVGFESGDFVEGGLEPLSQRFG